MNKHYVYGRGLLPIAETIIKNKAYICGKVTGLPLTECTLKFGAAQKQLEKVGFKVINPLEVVVGIQIEWKAAMKLCIAAMLQCNEVYALNNWMDSKGAICEVVTAWMYGIPVYELDTLEPLKIHKKIFEQYVDIVEEILLNAA